MTSSTNPSSNLAKIRKSLKSEAALRTKRRPRELNVKRTQLALLISCLPSLAIAGEWSDYKQSFPMFPCPDGWTTCEIDGATIGPGLVEDKEGNPLPSNMRFSFWNFDVMPSASPFGGVSEYDGDLGALRSLKADDAAVAEVEEEVVDDFDDDDFGGDAIPSLGDD